MARPARRPGNLPAEATSFVGRRRELAEVRKKLTEARLVSLVGPGGVGKTRLAIRAAADLGRGFRDGAWLVELAEVRTRTWSASAVLAALDLRDQAATEPLALLLSYLRDKELLLVVDNCEHLLEAAARLVTDLLQGRAGRAGDRHQPGTAVGGGGARGPGAAARTARARSRREPLARLRAERGGHRCSPSGRRRPRARSS